METPKYLQTLWAYKWLLLFGAIVAAAAAFFAGFTFVDGKVESRAEQSWTANTTMLLTSDSSALYQAEIPGVPIDQTTTLPQPTDMSSNALVYAYIIASDPMREAVEAQIGPLDEATESITALRRTTQPTGDERFPGRYELPVLEAIGTAATPERAEEISAAAASAFVTYLVAEQDAQQIAPEIRVNVYEIGADPAEESEDTSNPMIPVVVTFFGVFLAFAVLAFVIAGVRSRMAKRRSEPTGVEADSIDEEGAALAEDFDADEFERAELVGAGPATRDIPTHRG